MLCFTAQSVLYVGKCSMQTSGEHVFCCCWIEYSVNINWIKFNDTAIYMVIYIFVDFLSAHLLIFCLLINCWQRGIQFSSVQSLSHVRHFVTPWTAACQASLSITNCWSLLKLMFIESVMPSNHLILCHPLLPPSIFPSIRVFSSESVLHIRWPKYWSFSFSISPSNEYLGLIFFRIDWLDLLAVQGTLSRVFSNTTVQTHQFFSAQLAS